jgi:hypothetical protein
VGGAGLKERESRLRGQDRSGPNVDASHHPITTPSSRCRPPPRSAMGMPRRFPGAGTLDSVVAWDGGMVGRPGLDPGTLGLMMTTILSRKNANSCAISSGLVFACVVQRSLVSATSRPLRAPHPIESIHVLPVPVRHYWSSSAPPQVRVIGAGTQKRQPQRHERPTPDIFRLGRIICYFAALLGCISPDVFRAPVG